MEEKNTKSIYQLLRERDNSPPSVLKEGAVLDDIIKTFAPNFYENVYPLLEIRDVDGVLDWAYGNKVLYPNDPETIPLINAIERNLDYDAREAFRRVKKIFGVSSVQKKPLPAPSAKSYLNNKF